MPRKKGKTGRPTRREKSTKALAGVDVSKVDPKAVLQGIAADASAPASARVAAAKALIVLQGEQPAENSKPADVISIAALRILQGGRSDER